ncbi:Phosphopantetheine adenylyltransferase [Frankliniella fusca]|uniref:Phosphopantetheine adenylyltransferase n=1 Tax=Frankliniella fusca TaxID=407009 RepID=A0AAE1LA89_9NEOP|nr:Phosphopantetheine adenylyltransferase [Frankliniella fusca]
MDVAVLCVVLLLCSPAHGLDPAGDEIANEAAAALALLSPFLDTQNATLLLYGKASWTGDFLRRLSPRTARMVLPDTDRYWERAGYSLAINVLVMFVWERPADPWTLMQEYEAHWERALYWFTVQDESVLSTPPVNVFPFMLCGRHLGAVVAAPSGSIGLYHTNDDRCIMSHNSSLALNLSDRWSPTEQRWQRAGGIFKVFTNFCSSWRLPDPPEPLNFVKLTLTEGDSWMAEKVFDIARRSGRNGLWKSAKTTINVTSDAALLRAKTFLSKKIRLCRLDAYFSGFGVPRRYDPKAISFISENKMYSAVVVVPAGLGPAVSPLAAVTLEFSTTVWWSTALAALCTAAALACALRRDRGAALLLALAPLLAQAPPPPPPPAAGPALRPLLAVWLLVCVVIAAAYQGLLLGMLSSARPRGEIDSLEALEDSGLQIDMSIQLAQFADKRTNDISKIVNGKLVLDLNRALQDIALHRNSALIAIEDPLFERSIRRVNIPQTTVHRFSLGRRTRRALAKWTPGSPLGMLLASTYQRLVESGILDLWDNVIDDLDRRNSYRHGLQQQATALARGGNHLRNSSYTQTCNNYVIERNSP